MMKQYSFLSIIYSIAAFLITAIWIFVAYIIFDIQNFQAISLRHMEKFKFLADDAWSIMYDEENSKAMIRTRRTINVRLRKDPYYTAPLEILDIPPSPIYEVPSTNSPYFTGRSTRPPNTRKIVTTTQGISRMYGIHESEKSKCNCCEGETNSYGINLKCPVGVRGNQGEPGIDGENGEPGEDGVPGFTPVLTEDGELTDGNLMYDYESNMLVKRQYSCIACPVGPQGAPGLDGLVGERGSPGADGSPGIDGFSNIGTVGPMGDEGAQGERGKTGQPGIPGESAIMIVDLPGPKGLKGQTGAPGLMGLKGEDYVGYAIAPPGQVGVMGEAGKSGLDGAFGLQGPPGEQGIPGIDSGYCRCPSKKSMNPYVISMYDKRRYKKITDNYARQWKQYVERVRKRRLKKLKILI